MTNLGTPIPQRYRPIALSIFDQGGGGLAGLMWTHIFLIRPEELTYTHPARVSAVQTLGGAFADDFGEGLIEAHIAGHTGWRGSLEIPGELQFLNLRELVWKRYFNLRNQRASAGQDPDQIEMILTDTLNVVAAVVVPQSFQLRRHRSRPLLYQFDLRLTVVRPFF